jgi:hypothetical protein
MVCPILLFLHVTVAHFQTTVFLQEVAISYSVAKCYCMIKASSIML